jgi:hypothetical protein
MLLAGVHFRGKLGTESGFAIYPARPKGSVAVVLNPGWAIAQWGEDLRMQFIDQLLNFLRQGLAAIFRFVDLIWRWSVEQIQSVPWSALADLPLWKQLLLILVAGGVLYLLYRAARELLDAGEKALAAFATLLTVFVKTLPPILLAGVVAAVGAWVVNNVSF